MNKLLRILLWLGISLLGVAAVSVAAFHRGEHLNALWLVVAGVCSFAVAYRFYSSWLMAKVLTLPDVRERLTAMGLTVGYMTPAQLASREQAYAKTWARIIKDSGFTAQ